MSRMSEIHGDLMTAIQRFDALVNASPSHATWASEMATDGLQDAVQGLTILARERPELAARAAQWVRRLEAIRGEVDGVRAGLLARGYPDLAEGR